MKIKKKIQTVCTHDYKKNWHFSNLNFRDINSLLVYDEQDRKWYGPSWLLFIEATYYAVTTKKTNAEFDANKFFADFYLNKKKGSGYVVGNFDERKKLNSQGKGFLMPIIQLTPNSVSLSRNEVFYALLYLTWGANFCITKNCQHSHTRKLSDEDKKQLKKIYPGFCHSQLDKWVSRVNPTALDLTHQTEYGFIPIPRAAIIGFSISNSAYKKWFKTGYTILDEPTTVDILELISQCEKLFDKNVLPIKKLVKDIGD